MFRFSPALVAALVFATPSLHAQKIDSLALHLHMSREKAVDAVVSAFTQTGLGVTTTTPSLVEADQGRTSTFGGENGRMVRAILFGADSMTTVVMIGDEIRYGDDGHRLGQRRIDNQARGNGGKVWKKMIAAAMMLDSASVPEAARPQ